MKKIFLAIGIVIFVLIAVFIARNAGLGNSPSSNSNFTNEAIPNQIQSPSIQTIVNPETSESEINEDDENEDDDGENNIAPATTAAPTQPIPNQTSQNAMPSMNGITVAELATHNTKEDCWIVYQNKVYDITSFLPRHPGGVNAIARHCGKQTFEQAFVNQHGTRKVSMMIQVTTFIGDFDMMGMMR